MKKMKWMITLLLLSVALCGVYGCSNDKKYDVIVVGGDPEGVCAAVSSARNGLKTLLIEDDDALGGLMTLGKLNFIDICESRDGTILTQGLFMEFYNAVGGTAFDVEQAKQFFYNWVTNEKNATLKLNTAFVEPVMDGNTIVGVVVEEDGEQVTYMADRIIDATVDADVAAAAGVPYTVAGEDIGKTDSQMGVTLVFELSDVDWDAVTNYLEGDDNAGTGATYKAAWGYGKEGYAYVPQDKLMRLRGFNAARQDNGNVLINALIVFGVDPLNEESKAAGIARAQAELEHIMPYVRENFIGFEHARLVGTAEQLYVRESRHIVGEYQLTIDDVLENRDHWDKIAIGAYPVDVQPTATQTYGTVIGSPDKYAIPFRCLVPLQVDNMLVVGRSASYMSLAAGSARVIPIGMAEGEAAGVACAYSIDNEISLRNMTKDTVAISTVQDTLKGQGAYLPDFTVVDDVMKHWAYPGVKALRSLGLVAGGYNNDYKLDTPITRNEFVKMGQGVFYGNWITGTPTNVTNEITSQEILDTVAVLLSKDVQGGVSSQQALIDMGVLTEQLQPYFADGIKVPNRAEVIMLLANACKYYVGQLGFTVQESDGTSYAAEQITLE